MVGIKEESSGFRKGNRKGISSRYNIRCDPELGVGKSTVRRIPCVCSFCIEQLDLPLKKNEKDTSQKRHIMNKKYLNWNIFEGLNDWNIIILVTQNKNKNIEKGNEDFKTILRRVETRMSEKILITMYGAIKTDDQSTDGYYVLQWTSERMHYKKTKIWRVIYQQ